MALTLNLRAIFWYGLFCRRKGRPVGVQLLRGYEELGGDMVAESLGPVVWRQQSVEKGQAGCAGEEVGDLVGEGENLGGNVV